MKSPLAILLSSLVLIIFSSLSLAGEQFINRGYAVGGYDTVAYFTDSKPIKGDKKITTNWNNAKWVFSSEDNKALFLSNPEKYAPAYDGHCAYAAGINDKVSADPTQWSIINDRLFLNYSKKINDRFLEKPAFYVTAGDENWIELSKKGAAWAW